ncbi:hypothetical protein AAE478_000280 [Parahypoxylon ruwenzoriense]
MSSLLSTAAHDYTVFTGTINIVNKSPITAGVEGVVISKEAAVALLHDHAFFLRCDPHFVSHRPIPPTEPGSNEEANTARRAYQVPANIEPLGSPAVKLYEVVDHVPNPVWSSSVVSKEEFVDFKDGLWVRIRSPLAVIMETRWTVRARRPSEEEDGEEEVKEGNLELVEDVDISCSKLLLSLVKGQVENNWKGIHKKIIDRLVEDAKKEKAKAGD